MTLIAQFRAFLRSKAGDLVLGQRADTPHLRAVAVVAELFLVAFA
jgi:hypothetical protein